MFDIVAVVQRHRSLLLKLVQREVLDRYRGSMLGLVWSFMHPLFMLLVYMFVFGIVFRIRWGVEGADDIKFGVVLFSGLIVHALFAECLVRSPGVILSNPQFVKKVVFPLEILPVVTVGVALFHMAIGLLILLLFNLVAHGTLFWTILLVPLIILPLVMMGLGVSWFLSSLGVFLRDVSHVVGILATVLLFLCPIFYPISAVPEGLQAWMYLNPLTLVVEEMRDLVIFGRLPDWSALLVYYVVALSVMIAGFWWFNRTRRAFADVI